MKREFPPGGPFGSGDEEVHDEIRFYLEERARELVNGGMSPDEAEREARRRFGDVARIEAEVRRMRHERERRRGWMMGVGALVQDVRLALRGFARRPGFSLVVVTTLALGIGAVTAIFTVVNATMLRALPFEDAPELVFLQGAFDAPDGPQVRGASPPEARDWGAFTGSFEAVAAVGGHAATLTEADGAAERLSGEMVDRGYFDLLRVEPVRGRLFSEDEYESDAVPVVVIGESLWERRWGRDDGVIGRSIVLDDRLYTVVGVAPAEFGGTNLGREYWLPLVSAVGVERMAARGSRWLNAVARLRPGVQLESAQADVDAAAARLARDYPDTNGDRIALVTPMRDLYLGETRTLFLVLLGATGLLMAIAAANVANLMLVRATSRSTETLMRRALGAGRITIARHTVVESAVHCVVGAAGGLVVGFWGVGYLANAAPPSLLPAYATLTPDVTVFGAVVALMSMVALVVGVAPQLVGRGKDLASGLRGDTTRTTSGSGRIGNALVAGEVGLALMLLVGAALMVQSLRAQLGVDTGFAHDEIVAFSIQLPPETYPDAPSRLAAMSDIEARLAAVPGVESVGWGPDAAPLFGGSSAAFIWTNSSRATEDRIRFYFHGVTPGWFDAVGAEIAAGRAFEPGDTEGWGSVIISESFAARHFGTEDPVGKSLFIFAPESGPPLTVVGVARDVRWRDLTTDLLAGPTDPDVWIPFTGDASSLEVVVRASGDPADIVPAIVEAAGAFDADAPPQNVTPIDRSIAGLTAEARFGSLLLGVFSVLATILAAVGLYGVLSFAVGRRSREIAVRMALGADRGLVQRMVVRDGLKVAAIGLALGLVVAFFASRSLEAFLFAVEPVDALTYAGVAMLMLAVAGVSAWLPALRATRTDPQRALAGE